MTWWVEYKGDVISLVIGVLLIASYHIYLARRSQDDPHFTVQSVNRDANFAWARHIMNDPKIGILAIQTLRNSTMAATFLASTAVLLIMGVLTLSAQADTIAESWHALNFVGSHQHGLWVVKLLALLADLMVAFFSFAMSVRQFNQVGYQISLPPELRPAAVTPEQVGHQLNHASTAYNFGMRAYFLSVPLVFWLFSPHLLIVASAVLVVVLYRLDRTPQITATVADTSPNEEPPEAP